MNPDYMLLNGAKDDPYKYSAFSCIIPFSTEVGKPWVSYPNSCPCNPNESNPTGRGYTSCTYGVQMTPQVNIPHQLSTVNGNYTPNGYEVTDSPVYQSFFNNSGSMYNQQQYTAPQLQPRQLVKIGYTWRS